MNKTINIWTSNLHSPLIVDLSWTSLDVISAIILYTYGCNSMEKCVKMVDGKFNNKCDNTCIRTCQKKCPVSTSEGLNAPGPPRWGWKGFDGN